MKRWAREHDECKVCGQTDSPHKGHGVCRRCDRRLRYEIVENPVSGPYAKKWEKWAKDFDQCQKCGTSEKPHKARGYCKGCYTRVCEKESRDRSKAAKAKRKHFYGKPVSVPVWDLRGRLASEPYLFYGQLVCDIDNQYGERVMQIPARLVKMETYH